MTIIAHVSAYDISGGAARAAYRIHRSLVDHGSVRGLTSRMRALVKASDDPTVFGGQPQPPIPGWRSLRPRLNRLVRRGFRPRNPTIHTIAWPSTGLGRELEDSAADLLHLHWLGDHTLSIGEVGRLSKPLVWTLHDQWAFCGAEHYTGPGEEEGRERFHLGYLANNRPIQEAGPDLNRRTWLRKAHAWKKPISIVCPSRWLADCTQRSALMGHWPVTVIPYPIDLKVWSPCDQVQARTLLDLPLDRPLVLFGALGGTADPRKGADLLMEALRILKERSGGTPTDQAELVVFGQSSPADPPRLAYPIHYRGRLHDDVSLRLLYAAVDVFVIPSRQDNLPNTGVEAHACGTSVVAFRTGGLPDIVQDRVTGALAEPFDPRSLAESIGWVLSDSERRAKLGQAARTRAEQLWDPARIARMYAEVYENSLRTRPGRV